MTALLSAGLLASTSAMAVDNIQSGYAGAEAGDWGGKKGAVIGPADDTCANMGAVGKVNLVSNFGFSIPLDATITELRAFTKAGASSLQNVGVQLATDATVDPPAIIGNEVLFPFPDVGSGNCAVTVVSDIGDGLGFWGLGGLAPAAVNSPNFGMVFTKKETSEIKVDSICMQIDYVTDEGPAVVEECFAPPAQGNTVTVTKAVVGAAPGTDWAYTGTLGAFSLPAGGGFQTFEGLPNDIYTITETTKPGYTVTSECLIADVVVATGGASIDLDLTDVGDQIATCVFTNTQNVASFTVNKDFSDDNPAAVDMTLTCTSGTVTTNPLPASEASPAVFEVTGFEPGATCTATEAATPGYTQVTADCENGDAIGTSCTMVNNLNVGAFTVNKDFSDDNPAAVDMTLTCTSGVITTNPLPASEASPAVFEISGYLPGATCTATEAATPGYTQVTADCENGDAIGTSCTMVNNLNVGAFTVNKDFSDDAVDSVDMTLTCTSGTVTTNPLPATEASPAVFEVTGYLPGATCTATEAATPGYTQVTADCENGDPIDGSCTMVNNLNVGAFTVNKDFSDDAVDSVDMTLTCTSGTVTTNPLPATEASPAVFEVTGYLPGATCTATEAATPGYDQDDSACQAEELSADGGACTMVNTLRSGEFTVFKTYDDGSEIPVTVTASCTGGGSFDENPLTAAPGDPAVFTYTGFISDDPTCTAVESDVPGGYSSDNADCQDDDPLDGSCTIVNTLDAIARFRVHKDFSDNNDSGVMVQIVCDTGLPLEQDFEIFEEPGGDVIFVVEAFLPGTMECIITESPTPDGYTGTYTAELGVDGIADTVTGGDEACVFGGVVGGNFNCEIFNQANPATFTVNKEWIIYNDGGDVVYEEVAVRISCESEIVDGVFDSDTGLWHKSDVLGDGGSLVAIVDTTDGPATCWADENIVQSGVVGSGDCGARDIPAGGSSECKFVNTVFFEGIPTLNQYGLALMALLMLGMGAIGFRRFV